MNPPQSRQLLLIADANSENIRILKKFISEEDFIFVTKRYSDRIAGINLPRIYKSRVIHSDGATIDVEFNFCVIPYGRSLAALVFVRDIREEEAWKYCI